MVTVTRLNNLPILINPHLIEFIEATPDTLITFTTGKKMMVKQTIPELLELIIKYRQLIAVGDLREAPEVFPDDN